MKRSIGLDIGGTKCAITVGEIEGDDIKIVHREEFPTAGLTWQQVLAEFSTRIRRTIEQSDNPNNRTITPRPSRRASPSPRRNHRRGPNGSARRTRTRPAPP